MTSQTPWSFDLISFLIGFMVAGFLGNILQRIRLERGIIDEPNRPMTIETEETPNMVRNRARGAFWRFILLWILFCICVVVIVAFLYLLMQK